MPKKKDNFEFENDSKKRIYGFLSQAIYKELINEGVDVNSIFTILIYLNMGVVKEYLSITRNVPYKLNDFGDSDISNVNPFEDKDIVIRDLLKDNIDMLLSIYDDIVGHDPSSQNDLWYSEWIKVCRFVFLKYGVKKSVYAALLGAIAESLNVSHNEISVSLALIKKVYQIRNRGLKLKSL